MSKPRKPYYSLRSFLSYLGTQKRRMAIVGVIFLISNISLAMIPVFIGLLVGAAAANPIEAQQIGVYTACLIAASLLHDLTWRCGEYTYLKLLHPMSFEYETLVFKEVIRKPYPYFVDKFTGKISSYVNTLGRELHEGMERIFWEYIDKIVSLVAVSIILTAVNWQTGLMFVSGLLLMVIVGRHTIKNSLRYEQQLEDQRSTKSGKIIDTIGNFVNVKSFHKERAEISAIKTEQDKTITLGGKTFIWSILFWGSMSFFVRVLMWPGTILFNVHLFINGQIGLAELTTFLTAILLFTSFIWQIIWEVSQFGLRLSRMEEAHLYLFGPQTIPSTNTRPRNRTVEHKLQDTLRLQDISFAYPDKPDAIVLSDINLRIKKGEKVGIVGRSGGGKTTIVKLLLGYYPLIDGSILLDGHQIDTSTTSRMISYVPQDTTLFHRTIAENIAYACDDTVPAEDVVRAAKQAHADEFIAKISDGYEALVGERGVKLSAGQRQRIAIARAFLDDKPILVLDEATSALDSESEVLIQKALEALWHDKTVIAIAHRLSTLRNMDRIIVLDQGRIIEEGSHHHLLEQDGAYAKLWSHQSGGFIEE